ASQNFASTTQITVTSAQQDLLAYLKSNHTKVSSKVLNHKISALVDSQLAAANTAGTYDQTFQQTLQNEVQTYLQDLQRAFQQTKGPKGSRLLANDYHYAQLLLEQIN